jgi:RNA polymerase nonessential primary-like sigma factor
MIKKKAKSTQSRSSTMPGFAGRSDRQRAYREGIRLVERRTGRKISEEETPEVRRQRRKENGDAMYRNSASVPDSLVQFADEIHQEDRISRNEEIELGEKTQEALRLQSLYDALEAKLEREPTDEEWCAAAGKINTEAIRQAIEDGLEAKNKLVTSNLRMVQSVVNTYIRNGLSGRYNAGDMMQEGIIALIRAAEKFEPDRGWKFSTYAMYWVRASVKRSQIYQSRIIPVPQRLFENHKRLLRTELELTQVLGRKPTKLELGQAVGMSEVQVERCLTAMSQQCVSLDQGISNVLKPNSGDRDGSTLIEIVESRTDNGDFARQQQMLVREALIETLNRHLDPDQVELLMLRFGLVSGEQLSIAELSRMVGLKPDNVRRRIGVCLQRLRAIGVEEWLAFERELQ